MAPKLLSSMLAGTLALSLLAGCGGGTAVLGAMSPSQMSASAKATERKALESRLESTASRFLALSQSEAAPSRGMSASGDGGDAALAALTEIATTNERLYALAGETPEGLQYAAAASQAREAIASAQADQKRGFFGRLRDGFWNVLNVLAKPAAQAHFQHPKKPTQDQAAVERLSAADIAKLQSLAQPGDLIMWGGRTSFVHGAIYLGNGQLIHALACDAPTGPKGEGVFQESIEQYVTRTPRHRVALLRAPAFDAADVAKELAYAKAQVGKHYDNLFRTKDEGAFYCTELCWHAVEATAHPPRVGMRSKVLGILDLVMSDDLRLSPDFKELWSKNAPDPVPAK